jgi:type I restriction enzyme R subunit
MQSEAEWLTRKGRIDARLKQRGWKIVRFNPELNPKALDRTAVEELPTGNGPADYALFIGGKLLGIIHIPKYEHFRQFSTISRRNFRA